MNKKLIHLDAKRFNLMLERMENRVNYDESIELKKSLITEDSGKGGIGTIIKGFKGVADEISELGLFAKAMDGEADDLNRLVRKIDENPTQFKVNLNNALINSVRGIDKNLLLGLDEFVDNISIIAKSDSDKVYSKLYKKFDGNGKNFDESVQEIVRLWDDIPEILTKKNVDIDFPINSVDDIKFNHIRNSIASNRHLLPSDLAKYVDEVMTQGAKGVRNQPLDELAKVKNPSEYLVVSKPGDDGILLLDKNTLDNLGIRKDMEIGLKNRGYEVVDGTNFKGTSDTSVANLKGDGGKIDIDPKVKEEIKKLKDELGKTQKEQLDVMRRGKIVDWFVRNKGRNSLILLALYLDVIGLQFFGQLLSCIWKNTQGELRRVKEDNFKDYLRKREELQNQNPDATKDEIRDNKELLQYTEPVTIEQCIRTVKYADEYQSFGDYDPKGIFKFYLWGNPFTILSDPTIRIYNSINLKDFINLKRIGNYVSSQIMVPIEKEIEENLSNKNIIKILNFSCQGKYNKEDLRKRVENEFKDEPGISAMMDIINYLDEDGEATDAAITTIINANEELAKSQSEIKKLKEKAQEEFTGSMTIDTNWNGLKGGKGADLKSQAIRACLRGKGLAFAKVLEETKGINQNLNDILLYTDGSTKKSDIIKLAEKQVSEGTNLDFKNQLNLTTSNAKKNVEEAINLLKYVNNVCEKSECSGVKNVDKTLDRFESLNFDDKYLNEQWNTVIGLVESGDYKLEGTTTRIDIPAPDLDITINFDLNQLDYSWQKFVNGKSKQEVCNSIQSEMQRMVYNYESREWMKMLQENPDLMIPKGENIDGQPTMAIEINDITITQLAKTKGYGWCVGNTVKNKDKNESDCTQALLSFAETLPCYEE